MLHHRKQARLYGCAYHALYAVTGEEAWLDYVEDISRARWHARLITQGLTISTCFTDQITESITSPVFWRGLQVFGRKASEEFTHYPLLVTVGGRSALGRHLVGVALPLSPFDPVYVSDSALDDLLTISFEEFLASEYAKAHEVEILTTTNLDAYPFESGALATSTADPTPYVM